jgi:hypothetical protein
MRQRNSVSPLWPFVAFPLVFSGSRNTSPHGSPSGQLHFPNIFSSVRQWLLDNPVSSLRRIVFCVYTKLDELLYRQVLASPTCNQTLAEILQDPTSSSPSSIDFGSLLKDDLEKARAWLQEADAVLVTAGAGLSAAAGLDYNDQEL